jgi:hypothetical protein
MNVDSIKRRIRAVTRSARRPVGSGWAATVGRVVQELENLNRSTERDFLAVGEKMLEFRSTARQIQSDMAAVTGLISGEQGRNASEALTGMLEHSREMDARIEQGGQALASVRDLSNRLRRAFSGLPNMVSVFRTLCTLTRIETARLGSTGADLGHLAAEIRPLSESIQMSGEGVLEACVQLDRKVQSAIRSGAELRITQLKEMPELISSVAASLGSLEERRKLAIESSQRQEAQYAAVCEAMEDLVGSIQFHDITRQQVEHVAEALRHLRSTWKSDGQDPGSAAPHTGAILTLQCSQLADAARIFASSIGRIEHDLESIAARVENASEAVQALMGTSGDDHTSFFVNLEGRFSSILHMLCTCAAAQAEMDSTTSGLEETIGRMRDSVAEIRGTEIQIQRISTNATIRATHIGAAGVALNKIAEGMQRLALESNTNTEEVAGALDAMSDAAGRVAGSEHAGSGTESTTERVVGEMRLTIAELHSTSETSFSRVNQIAQLGKQLAVDIGALRESVSAGRLFAEVVERVRGELEAIGAEAGPISSEDSGGTAAQHLEHFAETYTMQSQRDVHESVIAGGAVPAVAPPAAAPPAVAKVAPGDRDLGENVELF